jgi:hypothetical protein
MSITISYTIDAGKAISGLERAKQLRGFKEGLVQAAGFLIGMQANYPPESHRPQPFKSEKQRRYFFWALRHGIINVPYIRTFNLARSFQMQISADGMRIDTGTLVGYAQWTHGERQALYHAVTGWRKESAIANSYGGQAFMLVYNAARSDFE